MRQPVDTRYGSRSDFACLQRAANGSVAVNVQTRTGLLRGRIFEKGISDARRRNVLNGINAAQLVRIQSDIGLRC